MKRKRYPCRPSPDLLVQPGGTVTLFTPLTAAAREWVAENVSTEPWQWGGASFAVEWRFADAIAEGAAAAGLAVV